MLRTSVARVTIGVRLAAFNIAHGRGLDRKVNLARTASVIGRTAAHVVCLQEVDRHFGDRSGYADQALELSRTLDMQLVYGASVVRSLREGRPREYGNAILSHLPILSHELHPLPGSSAHEPRSAQRVLIELDGGALWVINTHLSHDSANDRAAQARVVRGLVDNAMGTAVIAGDFNADDDAPELVALADLRDAWTECGQGNGYTHPARRPNKRLDHVLCSAGVIASASAVMRSDASDHLPLIVDLLI
ncbi:MAG: endonuclease/exonuclease/phosphatase family protein [Geodermatophilaceae bacterium]|nr:endonuclease/exonuclease/phosphatase family protein [Geodermatophilaceae bacterium]